MTRQQIEQRERDRDLMLQFMMSNMLEMRPMAMRQHRAEDEMLQKALADSRAIADPRQLNPDDMTYE